MPNPSNIERDDNRDCPVCGQRAILWCRCALNHCHCPAGHEWHTCGVHGSLVIGPSSHEVDGGCTCQVAELMRT